jgi:hypothetical protein
MAGVPTPAAASPSPINDGIARSIDAVSSQLQKLSEMTRGMSSHVAEIAKNTRPKPEVHGFLAEMHAPDWIQLFLLIVAVGALIFSAITTKQNSRAVVEASKGRDTENYLKLFEKFNETWSKFSVVLAEAAQQWRAANKNSTASPTPDDLIDAYPQFVELMNLFEAVCHMHNEGLLPKVTARAMADYMKGMLPIVAADQYASAWIKKSTVNPDVYSQIKKFAAKNSLALAI